MLAGLMVALAPPVLAVLAFGPADLEGPVVAAFEDCTMCHDDSGDPREPGGLDLSGSPAALVGKRSAANGNLLVVAGQPDESYLMAKLRGDAGIAGEPMPLDEDPLGEEQLAAIADWIAALPSDARSSVDGASEHGPEDSSADGTADVGMDAGTGSGRAVGSRGGRNGKAPFHGTHQVVLPTTASLGPRTLQYRIDHRFGRIGTERGAFGLDAGVVMSFQVAYGILEGWDVQLRRTNSRKDWELGSKYVAVRQEDGMPVSFGAYASMEYLRDFDVANELTGNVVLMLSRLWFERWSTMLTVGYHFNTNHNPRVIVDKGDGPVAVRDERDTMTLGFASTVWLGRKSRWGIDLEYFIPIPDGGTPNHFYYLGGDAGPDDLRPVGGWSIGGSLRAGLHLFQLFLTNNRQIHTNLWAPGGQTDNPFATPGVDRRIHEPNFFLGFNLARKFKF